ncbi:MAG: MFS transporter [Pseudonocardiaceae bacterium]|nr:MFS transporter [Pseudonocardiaceae bacterium]
MKAFPREIWVLVGASFLIAVGFGLVAPALPTFATSFDVGVTAASVVVSAFAFMRLAFAPVSGRLVTAFGERPVYLYGITIVGIGSLACAFAADYWQLLLFRSLSGIGSTMFTVSAVGLLIRMAPEHLRGRVSGVWATSFLLGSITGPALGSGLIAVSLRAPFLFYGVALLLVTVLVWVLLRRSTLAARVDSEAAATVTLRQALRHSAYRAALASNFTNGWTVIGIRVSLIPLFVTAVLHQPDSFAGIALAVFAIGDVAVLQFSGRLADSYGRKPMVLSGLGLLAVGTVLLGQSDTLWVFLAASLLAGMGAGALNPAQNATLADVLGSKARGGSVLAGFQMAADVGGIVGPLAAGLVADYVSYGAAFALAAGVAVIAMLMWVPARETLPAKRTGDDKPEVAPPAESTESA